jgi:tRNA 5-methylaminomethyl-2-thiouridine biosynthesis bifunctional protein
LALKPAPLQWSEDGILRSADFGDIYFQPQKGPEESYYVFLEQNHLPERFKEARNFCIAELGFGTGLNFLLTAKLWREKTRSELFYAAIEKHPLRREDLKRVLSFWPDIAADAEALLAQYPPMMEGFHHIRLPGVHLMLLFGDVTDVLPQLSGKFDAWYLDGFAPAKNPDMWSDNLFPLIAARTKAGGTLATFSAAGGVRRGLEQAGFTVEKTKGFGVKRDMTVARMAGEQAKYTPKKVTVLGAGIAGASAAYALAQKGHYVTVIDRHERAAAETSGNPAGIVYPKLTVDLSPTSSYHEHGFNFTCNLATTLNLPSWMPCGVLHLDTSLEDKKRHQVLAQSGRWPEDFLRYEEGKGLFQPTAGYLSPPEFCRALLNHKNIEVVFNCEASLEAESDAIVIALGYGSKNFKETAWLPLQAVRGQVSYLKPTEASRGMKHVICHDGFITPIIDGLHYAGATFRKEDPAAPDVRDSDHRENLQKLNQALPDFNFSEKNIAGGRTGWRATTPDKLPLIGALPNYNRFTSDFAGLRTGKKITEGGSFIDRLYLSTGFGAHGLTDAPLAGEIIACLISETPLPIPASLLPALAAERFILRDLKRKNI